ncbi:MAG: exodeoxyribonuclease III, partial [Streptococcaceae bacterium]|nr:exodeoxyribonuclease III [Streptococcaceae bacterium]
KKTDKVLSALTDFFPEYTIVHRISTPPARKGYAGTMMLYKNSLPEPRVTFPEIGAPEPMDFEGRVMTLEFPDFFVVNVYTPNSGRALDRLSARGKWDDAYRAYLKQLTETKPVFACGDFNVAHTEIDLKNPASNHHAAGFTDEERAKFDALLAAGFSDSFRHMHGDIEGAYTWFSQISKTSKLNNTGWRIDYWLVSQNAADKIRASEILDSGSRQDHVPILLEMEL